MKTYQIKTVDQSVLDVDTSSRRVKTVLNRANYKDFDGDVLHPNAATKTIGERGPQGKNLIWHLVDHNPSVKSAIGKFSEIYTEGDNLVGVTNIPNTTLGNDMMEHYKEGNINQHSIGFKTIQQDKQKDDTFGEYNLIKEIMLYEGSAVLWGANDATPTISVGKSLTSEQVADEYQKCIDIIGKITKSLRHGSLSDEACELMEIQLTQIQSKMQILHKQMTTEPQKCPECGTMNAADAKKCKKCGCDMTDTHSAGKSVDYVSLFNNYLKSNS